MKDKVDRSIASVLSVAGVPARPGVNFPPSLKPLHRRLQVHADRLKELWGDEYSYAQGGRGRGRTLQRQAGNDIRRKRDLLREDYLIPIGRAGRKLMKFAPGTEGAFDVPPKRSTAEEVVASARAMAKAVRPQWRLFVELGFPKEAAAKMVAAANERDKMAANGLWARKARTVRLAEIDRELRAARGIIDVMDGIVRSVGREDRNLQFHWNHAKRIRKKVGRPKKSTKRETPALTA